MGFVNKACKYTEDEVREIRDRYQRVRLLKNQMKSIRKEIESRERKLSDMRDELRIIKDKIIEDFDISSSAMISMGEGYSRRDVK